MERNGGKRLVSKSGWCAWILATAVASFSVGCAHAAEKPSAKAEETKSTAASVNEGTLSSPPTTPQSLKAVFPKDKAPDSPRLFEILERARAPMVKLENITVIRAYNVECRIAGETGGYTCSMKDKPSGLGKSRSVKVRGADAEALAMLLFGLPVAQGDSGVETRFVECVRQGPKNTMAADCSVAIDLDYQGP
jgi:hypothetical protein